MSKELLKRKKKKRKKEAERRWKPVQRTKEV